MPLLIKIWGLVVLVFVLLTSPSLAALKTFDTIDLSTPQAIHYQSRYYLSNDTIPKRLFENKRRVAILQFSIQYALEEEPQTIYGGGRLKGLKSFGKKIFGESLDKRYVRLEEYSKPRIPEKLYQQFKRALEAQGFEVVERYVMMRNRYYEHYYESKEHMISDQIRRRSHREKISKVYSLDGLVPYNPSLDGVFDDSEAEMQLLNHFRADLGLRVLVKLGIDHAGRPTVDEGTRIEIVYLPQKKRVSTDENPERAGHVKVIRPVVADENIISVDRFNSFEGSVYTLNSTRYHQAIGKIFPVWSNLIALNFAKWAASSSP